MRASLQRGQSITDVALAAGETVTDLLTQMREKMLAASDTSLSTASRKALNDDYLNLEAPDRPHGGRQPTSTGST